MATFAHHTTPVMSHSLATFARSSENARVSDQPDPTRIEQRGEKLVPVAVVGCGRMGRLHAHVYSQMPHVHLVGVYDANHEKARETAEEFECKAYSNLRDLLPHVAAASVAVPTKYHHELAEPFLKRGVACLIEKPLAKDVFEA